MKLIIPIIIIALTLLAGGLGVRCYKIQEDLRIERSINDVLQYAPHKIKRRVKEKAK